MLYKQDREIFTQAISRVLQEEVVDFALKEAAFPAYAHPNPLIRHIMWQRVSIVVDYLVQSKHQRVLDFGCGGGMLTYLLAQAGKDVVAYDLEYEPLRKIKKYITFPNNITWLPPRPSALTPYSNYFDSIVTLDVLEHTENISASLDLFKRILKPPGEVIVSGPTENFIYRLGRHLAGRHFTGEYHKSDVYTVKKRFAATAPVKTIARLYSPLTLFEIFVAKL